MKDCCGRGGGGGGADVGQCRYRMLQYVAVQASVFGDFGVSEVGVLNSWKLVTACLYELATSYLDRDNGLSMPTHALNHPVDIGAVGHIQVGHDKTLTHSPRHDVYT